MLKNYLTIGFRNLFKNKLFSAITIGGMAISIGSFLIIALFVHDEFQFDKEVKDAELKYRIYHQRFSDNAEVQTIAMIPPVIAPLLKAQYPEVDYYFRLMLLRGSLLFEAGEKKLTETRGGYGDPTVFDMFSVRLTEGDTATALKAPNSLAISETLARKYFNGESALGKTLQVNDEDFNVSAVFEDFPSHSHIQLDYFLSMSTLENAIPERMQSFSWHQLHTYIKLKPGSTGTEFEKKAQQFAEREAWPKTKPGGAYYIPHLMPLRDIHLHASNHQWDFAVQGNAQTVYILSATAGFIILIAILNFINLSTARAVNRVKEVGVRKVVGALRTQLIYQFISESLIVALLALVIGGLLTELSIPLLNNFTGKSIPTGVFLNPVVLLVVLITTFAIGVAAGAYPAFYISAYRPAQILGGKASGRPGRGILRKGLVVLQFILSFVLIIASLVVSRQHAFLRNKYMGFNKDNLIVLPLRGEMRTNLGTTKNIFTDHPNIVSATAGYGLPGEAYALDGITDKATKKDWGVGMLLVDHDFITTMDMKLMAGRDFSIDRPADDSTAFIATVSATKMLGYKNPEEALGHELSWGRWDTRDKTKEGTIIGVVHDINLNSLHKQTNPTFLQIYPYGYSTLTVKVKSEKLPETLDFLKESWKKFNAEWPFEYHFLDDNFDQAYKSEEKLAVMFTFFTGFTIFVACLGLFGLVVYSVSQKFKEISIRKVLGADVGGLVLQLTKSYLVLIAVAFLIAVPLSYVAAGKWLRKFAFHIEITPALFFQAALLIVVLSMLTVGIQSWRAARSNPVDALKQQ
jgi:putative ABC transport system permease protein